MGKTTLFIKDNTFTLKDSDNNTYDTPHETIKRLREYRTGVIVSIHKEKEIDPKHPPVPYDKNKSYYLLIDEENSTLSLLYVNLTNNVCEIIGQSNLYLPSDWFIKRMSSICGSLRILHSNDRRAWCIDKTSQSKYSIADDGKMTVAGAVPTTYSYRTLSSDIVSERWTSLAVAVNRAISYKRSTKGEQNRYAVHSEKGAIVFLI